MPPIEKRRLSSMSDILNNGLLIVFGQNRIFIFSLFLSSICVILIEYSLKFVKSPQLPQIFISKYNLQFCRRIICVFSFIISFISWVTRASCSYSIFLLQQLRNSCLVSQFHFLRYLINLVNQVLIANKKTELISSGAYLRIINSRAFLLLLKVLEVSFNFSLNIN